MTGPIEWRHWNAVNTVLQRFADAFDRADLAALVALFAEDAVWDHSVGALRHGRAAIGALLGERFAVYARTSHHIGPPAVRWNDDGRTLESVAYVIATHILHDGPSYTGHGRYISSFIDGAGGMLITRHRVVAPLTHGPSAPIDYLDRSAHATRMDAHR